MGGVKDGGSGCEDGVLDAYDLIETEDEPIAVGSSDDDEEVDGEVLDFGTRASVQTFQIDYTTLGVQFAQLTDGDLEAFFGGFSERAFLEEFHGLVDSAYLIPELKTETMEALYRLLDLPPTTMEISSFSRVHTELDTLLQRTEAFSSENAQANRNAKIFATRLQTIKANLTEERWAAMFA